MPDLSSTPAQSTSLPKKVKLYNGTSDETLATTLVGNEFLTEKQLHDAKATAKAVGSSLYEAILSLDLLSDENLGKLIADVIKLPFVVLTHVSIPDDVLHIVPESTAKKHSCIVFGMDEYGLKVATSKPQESQLIQFIGKKSGQPVKLYFATQKDIEESLRLYKKGLQKTFADLLHSQLHTTASDVAKEVPITRIVDLLIEYAYTNKASDIHLEPQLHDTIVRFRIDGVMHDVLHIPKSLHPQLVARIKVLSKLKTDEHFSSQDGKMRVRIEDDDVDIRVSIVPVVKGENIVMRLLSSRSRQFSLQDLGMSEADLVKVKDSYTRSFGMILATGPTGSGKTTTIYSVVKILNRREKNIATIENPVEYDVDGISQIQVNPKTNLTFADGLRSILRQDPDIIFVGEIRDNETADIAVNSALTGHLVLSTLHTNNAVTALPRLVDMHIEPFLVSSTVSVVIAQRLVRKICDICKVSEQVERSEIERSIDKRLVKKYFGDEKKLRLYHGKGCQVCNLTGYVGRVGVFEVLRVSPKIAELITTKADADTIQRQAVSEGMTTMFEDGLDKVQRGLTTIEEVMRATKT